MYADIYKSAIQNVHGVMLVFDITRRTSFESKFPMCCGEFSMPLFENAELEQYFRFKEVLASIAP